MDFILEVDKFLKFDADKLRYELIPYEALEALAKILTHGARKYKPNNWKNCSDKTRFEGAALRHIQAYRAGRKLDPDSGLTHLSHAITNLIFLDYLENDN